jgi:hypothetical protein
VWVDPSLSTDVVAFIELGIFFSKMVRILDTCSSCRSSNNSRSWRFLVRAIICVGHITRHVAICIAA